MSSKKGILTPPPHKQDEDHELSDWYLGVYNTIMFFKTKAGVPTAADIPPGGMAVYKDTTGGSLKLYANDGGTIKSVTLI
jgi:hypothetical protein